MLVNIFKDVIAEEARVGAVEREAAARVSAAEKRWLDVGMTFPPDWLLSGWSGIHTEAGITITPITAFTANTFYTCVDLISNSLASLPLHVYKRSMTKSGRAAHSVAYDHPYYDLLHAEPNEEMTRHTLIKTLMVHTLAWSNGYCELQRDAGGDIVGIWPRNPSATRPRRYATEITLPGNPWRPYPMVVPAYALLYETADPIDNYDFAELGTLKNGVGRLVLAEDMIHVPGLSLDGRLGTSVTYMAREILAQALSMVKYSSTYYKNYGVPMGLLELPAVRQEDRNKMRDEWQQAQSGSNMHRTAAMPVGTKYTKISNNPAESQATAAMQHLRTEIAALLHVPARMVGDTSKASRGTTEQENLEYLSYTLAPWINLLKQEFKRKLFPHPGIGSRPKNPYFVDFDASDMLRASAADRNDFYAKGKVGGFLNTNMILGMEKLNPIDADWAEAFWEPVNMADAAASFGITAAGRGEASATGAPPDETEDNDAPPKDSTPKGDTENS